MYGGSMFARSAASDTLQGRAIQAVNEKWGDSFLNMSGRESIGFPVCKKKYTPFRQHADGTVERMYGCVCHSHLRKAIIEKHGERPGWEPFGQWSLQKAKEMAKTVDDTTTEVSSDDSSSEDDSVQQQQAPSKLCWNGSCVWKVKSAYDDVFYELNGCTESEVEDNQE